MKISELRDDARLFFAALRFWGITEAVVDFRRYLKARRHELADAFDDQYGVETSQIVDIGRLEGVGPNRSEAVHYWPTRKCEFDRMMQDLEDIAFEDFTFIDVGCGKGRVVMMAAQFPFKCAMGFDFSPMLIESAEKNFERYTGPVKAASVRAVVADAVEFEIPSGNLIFYLFDPFGEKVLEMMVENVEKARQAEDRTIIFLYYSPDYNHVLRNAGYELVREGRGENWPWHIYRA